MRRLPNWNARHRRRGQALVEFTLVLPIMLTMVFSVAELGKAISENMSLELATREGARVGASLAAGGATTPAASVDPLIIASVDRALTSPGSGIDVTMVNYIRIYQANSSGGEIQTNEWRYGAGPVVDGYQLHFHEVSSAWPAASRVSALPPDSIGVSVSYRYQLTTPIGVLTGLFGGTQIVMTDRTVMAVEPSQ